MKTNTAHYTLWVMGIILVTSFSPVYPLDEVPPAHGLPNAVLVCDKSEDGLRVNFVEDVFLNFLRKDRGMFLNSDEPLSCLRILAEFPSIPDRELPNFAGLRANGSGDDASINEDLVWYLSGRIGIEAVVGCEPVVVENGEAATIELHTTFVDTGSGEPTHTPAEGERCRDTLAMLTSMGLKANGPISAALGVNAMGETTGGLLWVMDGRPGVFEVIECNMDRGMLRTTYRERSPGGLQETGGLCLDVLAERDPRLGLSGPMPIPQTSDPGCLIWDVDGGTILDGGGGGGGSQLICCPCAPICDCGMCSP